MAREAFLEVTQPYHGPGGELVYDVGHRFGLADDIPEGVRTAPVVEEPEDAPPPKAEKPAKAEAKADSA